MSHRQRRLRFFERRLRQGPMELPSGSRKLCLEARRDGWPFDGVAVEFGNAVSLHGGAHMARRFEQRLEARRHPVEGEEMAQKTRGDAAVGEGRIRAIARGCDGEGEFLEG